jgi:succinoglycan biosynthesis protein ExoV
VQLYCWRGTARNFGDELNNLLWPRLLPDFFDDDPAELFLGVGSVIEAPHAQDALKVVAGAGYGGYRPPPALNASWVFHWVRGPRTARCLGLSVELGLGDPAALLDEHAADGRAIGFMPHFESLRRGAWAEAARAAGVVLIDPRGDPAAIIAEIGACRVLLSEAMHGAIVADAMRVPWVALRPIAQVHRAKWQDWADTLKLDLRFHPLAPSSQWESLFAWLGPSRRGSRLVDLAGPALATATRHRLIEQAARSLASAAVVAPQLSTDTALDRCRTRMLERLESLRRDPRKPTAISLRPCATSAYHDG